ncbi:restriction endonuclease subunit S [Bacteroides thetaiotaomicron]|uniref:restriction endonuclease subunit S n=1 Tax=Bacteroides thetaiotaomicron TaxID=818 RepID=UPI001C37D075|nr:restriction endonuclease subunit S [Bacteroides thetaiotaomicron]MBV4336800.1 restriction endonuclease subunit S [Bacteroides thetaiotaomicron]MCB7390904.1 restriction endonuclease subunit S [Bacteroides thetaiotaomicron]MCB7396475.1 restriction endonuclease subunit S [Bacteroides thetaiotaomicron]MCB7419352.1 restriction endonuclease subunit S [Bacteroides thetaiotaomicron]MCB7431998.1 restriction endonuclease subunit S [Bacteroides thetaiotaomicron]
MNGKQLKNSILQWAIQGKLVPQDPNDEPASVLLDKIRQEKERLIKEKKIKRDKNASIIYRGEDNSYYEKMLATGEVKCIDEEIPFDVPQGWEWERWGNIAQTIQYGYNAPALEHGVIKMVRISDIQENCVLWDNVPYCLIDENDIDTYLLKVNDILFARTGGTVGKSFLVEEVPEKAIYAGYLIRTRYSSLLNPRYMKSFMESQLYWEQLKNGTIATAQPNCNGKTLAKMLLPIPPTKEQDRIVKKLTQLSSFLDNYGLCQDRLNLLNEEIKEQLKKSILQEAIQGKLVPQLAEEGTAQDLLEQIKMEKLNLVKEGKLKKSALATSVIFRGDDNKYYEQIGSEVTEIELPFDFPSSWSIVRLYAVCKLTDGLKTTGKQCLLDAKYLRGKSSGTIIEQGKLVYKGDNIMLVDGENSGEVFIVPQDGYMGSTFKQLWISSSLYEPYILAFIQFYKETLRNSKKGAAIPHLNKELFYGLIIGIPPFQEQKRIVQKIGLSAQLLK